MLVFAGLTIADAWGAGRRLAEAARARPTHGTAEVFVSVGAPDAAAHVAALLPAEHKRP